MTIALEIMKDLIGILASHGAKIGYAAVDKEKCWASHHPHQLAFLFLVERIEDLLKNEGSLGLLIADENHEMEQRLVDDLEIFKTQSTRFGWRPTKIEHVVDSIHFVRSRNNHLIQLADVVAYIFLRGKRCKDLLFSQYLEDKLPKPRFDEWQNQTAERAQKVDLELLDLVTELTTFSKVFPT